MVREQIIPSQVQDLINLIESQKLILAEVELPGITSMPDYDQVLRVEDNIIALSQGYLKVIPKRVLIHKVTKEEVILNLPVPNWERRESDLAALIDEATGERMMFETNYYEFEPNPEYDPEDPESEEFIKVLIETKEEPYHVPVLKYLKLMISNAPYSSVFESFTLQYVSDVQAVDPTYFTKLSPTTQINGLT